MPSLSLMIFLRFIRLIISFKTCRKSPSLWSHSGLTDGFEHFGVGQYFAAEFSDPFLQCYLIFRIAFGKCDSHSHRRVGVFDDGLGLEFLSPSLQRHMNEGTYRKWIDRIDVASFGAHVRTASRHPSLRSDVNNLRSCRKGKARRGASLVHNCVSRRACYGARHHDQRFVWTIGHRLRQMADNISAVNSFIRGFRARSCARRSEGMLFSSRDAPAASENFPPCAVDPLGALGGSDSRIGGVREGALLIGAVQDAP